VCLILLKYELGQSLFAGTGVIDMSSAPYEAAVVRQLFRLAEVVAFKLSCELLILLDQGTTRLTPRLCRVTMLILFII
jgi:hypothetical protein